MQPRTGIYPGTFDPIHKGHIDLIKRISKQYDHVIVAIASDSGSKSPSLSIEKRISYIKKAVDALKLDNIEVESFDGKVADFAIKKNAVIIRGLRNESDFKAESTFSRVNRALKPIEVILLVSDPAYDDISSTRVRADLKNEKAIYDLVPESVAESLKSSSVSQQQNTGGSINWKYKLTEDVVTFWQKNKIFLKGVTCGFVAACIANKFAI